MKACRLRLSRHVDLERVASSYNLDTIERAASIQGSCYAKASRTPCRPFDRRKRAVGIMIFDAFERAVRNQLGCKP